MIGKFQEMRQNRRNEQLKKDLIEHLKNPESEASKIINAHAQRMAGAMIMNWMNSKRINHCRFCPNTEQLRSHNRAYLCQGHYEIAMKQEAAEKAEPKKPEDLGLVSA